MPEYDVKPIKLTYLKLVDGGLARMENTRQIQFSVFFKLLKRL